MSANILGALAYVKIGRVDVPSVDAADRQFSFAHRRYQEVLFVQHVAASPPTIEGTQLLLDSRWREYCVTFLQTQDPARLTSLFDEATRRLRDAVARDTPTVPTCPSRSHRSQGFFSWDNDAAELVRTLHAGLRNRIEDVPYELRQVIEEFLSRRWEEGDGIDRLEVVQAAGLLPSKLLAEIVKSSVVDGGSDHEDAAFEIVRLRPDAGEAVGSWLRRRVIDSMLSARISSQRRAEALAERLPSGFGGDTLRRRARWLRRFGLSTTALRGAAEKLDHSDHLQLSPSRNLPSTIAS